jgi:ABC-type branched-subunit amino acid transport system substrate-binding protein
MVKMSKYAICGFVIAIMLISTNVNAAGNEIKLGQSMPYSGPAAAWGIFGKAGTAYFAKINDEGGINGKKVMFLSYDDAYSAPKALEQTRKLVEQDGIVAIYATGGNAVNLAIRQYLNDRKIPQLFITTGSPRFSDPEKYPWTLGWQPNYNVEARIYAKYALSLNPNAKIGILYQNDDFGKSFLKGIKDIIKETGKGKIVAAVTYETTDPTVDTQIIKLKSSKADVFFNVGNPKATVQAIKKAAEIDWRPLQFIYTGSASVSRVLKPAGFDNAKGIMTGAFIRDPSDPKQQKTKEFKEYAAWVKKYLPEGQPEDLFIAWSYSMAQTMEYVLHKAGNDFSRENLLKHATNIQGLKLPMLLPGIEIETSPTDYRPIESMQMQQFDGAIWQPKGGIVKGE